MEEADDVVLLGKGGGILCGKVACKGTGAVGALPLGSGGLGPAQNSVKQPWNIELNAFFNGLCHPLFTIYRNCNTF